MGVLQEKPVRCHTLAALATYTLAPPLARTFHFSHHFQPNADREIALTMSVWHQNEDEFLENLQSLEETALVPQEWLKVAFERGFLRAGMIKNASKIMTSSNLYISSSVSFRSQLPLSHL